MEGDVLAATAVLDGEGAGVLDLPAGDLPIRRDEEDGLGVAGGEVAAGAGGAGLEEERSALRRGGREERALDPVALALVEDLVDLVGVGEQARALVLAQRVLVPGSLPELVGDFGVLVGPAVALVVIFERRVAEVAVAVVLGAGDDVPGDPAAADVVERRHLAGEVRRVLLEGVRGDRQADVAGLGGERGDQDGRVVARDLQALAQVDRVVGVGVAVEAGHVGEEHRVELRVLERPRQVDPDVDVVEVVLAGVGAAPLSVLDVAGGVHHEGVEVEACHTIEDKVDSVRPQLIYPVGTRRSAVGPWPPRGGARRPSRFRT